MILQRCVPLYLRVRSISTRIWYLCKPPSIKVFTARHTSLSLFEPSYKLPTTVPSSFITSRFLQILRKNVDLYVVIYCLYHSVRSKYIEMTMIRKRCNQIQYPAHNIEQEGNTAPNPTRVVRPVNEPRHKKTSLRVRLQPACSASETS